MHEFSKTSASYDAVADAYTAHLYHELAHKPLDREWLARFARSAGQYGPICDLGCGPGHVARYLHEQGAQVLGMDLSPRMVTLARQFADEIEFRVGNMVELAVDNEVWGGIVAFYAIIHVPRASIDTAMREFWRVLRPGGEILLAFHVGDETRHFDTFMEQPVFLDFIFYPRAWIEERLQAAGFEILESIERDHYEGFEVATRRAYIHAHKPAKTS
jgi:SAM-dependent methyltransferase